MIDAQLIEDVRDFLMRRYPTKSVNVEGGAQKWVHRDKPHENYWVHVHYVWSQNFTHAELTAWLARVDNRKTRLLFRRF